jgi:hypothetical protein
MSATTVLWQRSARKPVACVNNNKTALSIVILSRGTIKDYDQYNDKGFQQ